MDNASKALIMAGAILISVAIVGIGLYIFNVANSMTTDAVNEMSSTQVSMFNQNFYRYGQDDNNVLGTSARQLANYCKTLKWTTGNYTEGGNKYTSNTSYDDHKYYKINYHYGASGAIDGVGITPQ